MKTHLVRHVEARSSGGRIDRARQDGHGEEKPLNCNICGKIFTSNWAVERHMQIHMNPEDTYDCHTCHEEVGQVLSLTEHVYMHDKGGNFTCPQCQKTFTENKNARKHMLNSQILRP